MKNAVKFFTVCVLLLFLSACKEPEESDPVLPDPNYEEAVVYLGDGLYYLIRIPEGCEYHTDNLAYFSGTNTQWSVTVISDVNAANLSDVAKLLDPETLSKETLKSEDAKSGVQRAARMVGASKALVLSCTNEPLIFATVLSGFIEEEVKELAADSLEVDGTGTKLLSLVPTEDTLDDIDVKVGFGSKSHTKYVYEDGTLTTTEEIKKFGVSCEELCRRLIAVSGQTVPDSFLNTGSELYAELGEYTIAAYRLNYNTTAVCFGFGNTARQNVRYFMRHQEDGR